MGEARDPRLGAADERNRAFDVAQRPQREREVEHRRDAGVLSEAKGQIVVAAGLEQGERAFQMIARFAILSGEPMRDSGDAMSDSGLGRIGSRLDVAEEGLGVRPHRRQLAPHASCRPTGRSRPPAVRARPCRRPRTRELLRRLRSSRAPHSRAPRSAHCRRPRAIAAARPTRPPPSRPPPCPPSRSPCRDGRSPPGRPSGAAPGRPPCPTIRSRGRRGRPAVK